MFVFVYREEDIYQKIKLELKNVMMIVDLEEVTCFIVSLDFLICILFNFAFDCQFCVVIRFFHPRHNGQWPPTSKDFHPRYYPLHFLTILILEKEPVFPFFNVDC